MDARRPVRRLIALGATVAVAAGIAAAVSVAPAAAAPPASAPWAVARSTCAQPSDPDTIRCFAQKLVPVPAGTSGAHRQLAVGHGPTGGYSPADLAKAYGYNPKASVHQTVGIVDWYDDPYVLSDLNAFDAHYHLRRETSKTFVKVNQAGHTKPMPRASRDSAGEISLDVEAVRAVCNKCKIVLVEASTGSSRNLGAAENTAVRLGATEVSNSWGGAEGHESKAFQADFKHGGVVITAATGDAGWLGWGYADGAASFPSSSNYVVAVSGTRLVLSGGARKSETVWDSTEGATGGGCSTHYGAQGWQSHIAGYTSVGCHGKRAGADISVLADPQYGLDTFDRYGTPLYKKTCVTKKATGACWTRAGGTSLSSPVVAAMYALAGGSGGSYYPAASLYVNSTRSTTTHYDVTSGGNSYCDGHSIATCATQTMSDSKEAFPKSPSKWTSNPNTLGRELGYRAFDCTFASKGKPPSTKLSSECNATAGFDGPSGLGAPKGLHLFADTSPGASITAAKSQRVKARHTFIATLHPVIGGTKIIAVDWSWGDGHKQSGTTTRVTHTYAKRGTYRVGMFAEDSRYQRVLRHLVITVK